MVIFLTAFIMLFTAIGQLLLKFGAMRSNRGQLINLYVLAAYALFVLVVFASYQLMYLMDLKFFSALMSMNYVTVALASHLVLKEKMGKRRALGTLLVVLGVTIFVIA